MVGELKKVRAFVAIVLAIGVCTHGAEAAVSLATDPNAIAAYQGRTTFADSLVLPPFFASFINADVEFAVYDVGQFGLSFAGGDPSGGTEYVYAYQIFNMSTLTSPVTDFSVGLADNLDADDDTEPFVLPAGNVGYLDYVTGTVAPSDAFLSPALPVTPTQAHWSFFGPTIGAGQVSEILLFTSLVGPELDTATVAGDWAATMPLPSPTPEPATLALLTIGAGYMLRRRKR